jgi:hypothetical protein
MPISENPTQNPKNIQDILKETRYENIISNISKDFKEKYHGYQLKNFLKSKPSLPLEVKVYNTYKKIIEKVPNLY